MSKIRILIADDHEMIRKGISTLLSDQVDISVLGSVENGELAVAFCAKNQVDVVLMDIQMPVMSGVEATRKIVAGQNGTKVLAVTINEETSFIMEILQAGATGYILKHSAKSDIINAIHEVASGRKHFSAEVLQKISNEFATGSSNVERNPDRIRITSKEMEVLTLLVKEKTNQEIAKHLDCSVRTIDTHKRNIIKKLGVRNVVGLIKYALKHKLV
jgi:DNA-binding NarL/FixJ family response regulator